MVVQDRPDFSLGYRRRLHHRSDFLSFFGKNELIRLRNCRVFRIPNSYGHFRLGITLKIKTSSVGRNQIKRAIRESFRQSAPFLGSYDYNVVVQFSEKRVEGAELANRLYREIISDLPKTTLLRKQA